MPSRGKRGVYAALLLAMAALPTLAGCAASSYAGIPLTSGAVDADLQELARRARGGNRMAQLELGLRFENGRGVPADPIRACQIYLRQPRRQSGEVWVWQPSTQSVQRYMRSPSRSQPETDRLALKAYECRLATAEGLAR